MMLVALAGSMNEQQLDVVEYLKEENRILRELDTIITPDTILRWYVFTIPKRLRIFLLLQPWAAV
jgi:hypothetical protein